MSGSLERPAVASSPVSGSWTGVVEPGPTAPGTEGGSARVQIHRRPDGTTVVEVAGEIDLTSVPGVGQAVLEAVQASAGRRVVVDLNRVLLLCGRGVSVLLAAGQQARADGGLLALVLDDVAPATRTLACFPEIDLPTFTSMTTALGVDAALTRPVPADGPAAETGSTR